MLQKLKILDFTTLLPGPYATMCLGDYGADIINIFAPGKVDLVLEMEPKITEDLNGNGAWLHRNKKSLGLNLKEEESVEAVKKLIREGYDIIVEQFRPGVMEKLGLSYEQLQEEFPQLIYCSISAFGQEGPDYKTAGHDINFLAKSGLMSHSGEGKPALYGMQIGDLAVGSMNTVVGILMAALARETTGKGDYIDISMYDGLLPFNSLSGASYLAGGALPRRQKDLLNGGSNYDFYETKDGRFLAVGALEPKFWKEFCLALGREDFIEKTVTDLSIKGEIQEIIASKSLEEWDEIFKDRDACVNPVLNLEEVLEDPHTQARELIVEREVAGKKIKQFANPLKFKNQKPVYQEASPRGGDTEKILSTLGYSPEEIEKMQRR